MLKILNAAQIKSADQATIRNEGIASDVLMERAACACVEWIVEQFGSDRPVIVFAGVGNNGGDALVMSRHLLERGYTVSTVVVEFSSSHSGDFTINLNRLKAVGHTVVHIQHPDDVPEISPETVVVDGIFGIGLTRMVDGEYGAIIDRINAEAKTIVAIDVPSGLFIDQPTPAEAAIIQADYTLTFQAPKLAFMMPQSGMYVGHWVVLDIGLDQEEINRQKVKELYVNQIHDFKDQFLREAFSHKGTFGHALMIAGSPGTMGACIMAARAVLRSGGGLLTTYVPDSALDIIQISVPESMAETRFDAVVDRMNSNKYDAIAVGPGVGVSESMKERLEAILKLGQPVVLDADALNIIARHTELMKSIPKGSILTPHPKEFERLFGTSQGEFKRLERLRASAIELESYIILKGAHSALATPNGQIRFNSTGNPGMATAGSGDVLTGIITGFLSQTKDPFTAAVCGMYVHGMAGDFAANDYGQHAMLATDIISYIGPAMDYSLSL